MIGTPCCSTALLAVFCQSHPPALKWHHAHGHKLRFGPQIPSPCLSRQQTTFKKVLSVVQSPPGSSWAFGMDRICSEAVKTSSFLRSHTHTHCAKGRLLRNCCARWLEKQNKALCSRISGRLSCDVSKKLGNSATSIVGACTLADSSASFARIKCSWISQLLWAMRLNNFPSKICFHAAIS